VLRLQGSGLCDLEPDRCVASDQIDSYLEPDGRSGIMSPSSDMDHRKWSQDASWASVLLQTGLVGRSRLELELDWASNLAWSPLVAS
jgi:hypothetical protein